MPKPTKPTLSPYTDQLPDVGNPATWADRTPLFWNWVTGDGYTNMTDALTYSDNVATYLDTALAGSETLIDSVTENRNLFTSLAHRNKIINGQFNVNQRGETSYTATGYTLDRWRLDNGSDAANTIKQGTFALGQTDVPGNPKHYLIWERATAGTALSKVSQRIEGVATFAGQTVTRTFWVEGSAATALRPVVRQFFGTGGTPSATASVSSTEESVTTGWTKITVSFAVPSVSGKTLGTNGDDYLELALERDHTDTNPTATVSIANVSIVEGNATSETDPGAWRSETAETHECWRYYWRSELNFYRGYCAGNAYIGFAQPLPSRMRITPSVTLGSPGVSANIKSTLIANITPVAFAVALQATSTGDTAYTGVSVTANAEI